MGKDTLCNQTVRPQKADMFERFLTFNNNEVVILATLICPAVPLSCLHLRATRIAFLGLLVVQSGAPENVLNRNSRRRTYFD